MAPTTEPSLKRVGSPSLPRKGRGYRLAFANL
jgi:hypothetical protein